MEIYLDGEQIDLAGADPANGLLGVLSHLQSEQRTLRQAALNGEEVEVIDLEQILGRIQTGEIESVVLRSMDNQELLMESVTTAQQLLPQLADELTQVAHGWQRGEDERAFSAFQSPLAGLQSLLSLWEMLLGHEVIPQEKGTSLYNRLGQQIQSIQAAWERQDIVSMTDTILYEICPSLKKGEKMLGTL